MATTLVTSGVWKHYNADEYFKQIKIPDNWETLENFVDWYMLEAKMALMIPHDASVIVSDDAAAVCIFRKGNYQVELYLEYPRMSIRKHSHPRMEVITMDLGGGGLHPKLKNLPMSRIWGIASEKLIPGEQHGGDTGTILSNGFCTLAFQKWHDASEMTSAAIQWKGELQGPIQSALIQKHRPNAYIFPEKYADVSIEKK